MTELRQIYKNENTKAPTVHNKNVQTYPVHKNPCITSPNYNPDASEDRSIVWKSASNHMQNNNCSKKARVHNKHKLFCKSYVEQNNKTK